MGGKRHSTSVWPGSGNRGYQFRCTCGASGYVTQSRTKAQQAGKTHEAKAH